MTAITPKTMTSSKWPDNPSGGRRRGTSFRGQSPDSDSRNRELDLTLDCGRYIGPPQDPPLTAR